MGPEASLAEVAMLVDDAIRFLSQVPPFQFLEPDLLREVVQGLSMEFHPKGSVIAQQDEPAGEHLRIIQKGAVKLTLRPKGGEEVVVDCRERGEMFGLVSLLGGQQKTTTVALQDTLCYLLPKARLEALLASHPALTEYLLQFHLTKYVDLAAREMQGRSLFLGSSDHRLFTAQVGEICRRQPLTVEADATIQEAAKRMVEGRQSAVLVLGAEGRPEGILTDSDLRTKVVAAGRAFQEPVAGIMSRPVVAVEAREPCFEVVLRMLQRNIHHVAVTREGVLEGLITTHDFMVLQGRSPLAFSEDIEGQADLEGLAPVAQKALTVVGALLREGIRSASLVRIISELNDRIVRRVLALAERELGPPPVPYCWLALGSEGRKEQTFRTDQDNALLYADPRETQRERVVEYFRRFTVRVRNGLIRCGFEPCPANCMASNPEWCQPLSAWKAYFTDWVTEPTPKAVLHAQIFLDFRPLHGDEGLAWELREHLGRLVPEHPAFLGFLAGILVQNRPPLGFFGAMAVERSGEHKDGLNLKLRGLAPVTDLARLFALERGLQSVSTLERLEALQGGPTLIGDLADELAQAFEFMILLRVHHQYRQMEAGLPIDSFIRPDTLSHLERQSLKSAFRLVQRAQDRVADRFKAFVF